MAVTPKILISFMFLCALGLSLCTIRLQRTVLSQHAEYGNDSHSIAALPSSKRTQLLSHERKHDSVHSSLQVERIRKEIRVDKVRQLPNASDNHHYAQNKTKLSHSTKTKKRSNINHNKKSNSSALPASSIRFPSQPDPRVRKHLARAWTEVGKNSTMERLSVQNDPYLQRVRLKGGVDYCPITAQLQLEMVQDQRWTIQTLDEYGNLKLMGGDEFYVTFRDIATQHSSSSPTAIAYALDQENGQYILDFVQSPFQLRSHDVSTQSRGGLVTVELQFTCGFGKLKHGTKLLWNSGGTLMIQYNVTVPTSPPIRAFPVPNKERSIDLGIYDKVHLYGDSNLQMFHMHISKQIPNLHFAGKPEMPLSLKSLQRKHLKATRKLLNESVSTSVSTSSLQPNNNTIALITGSSTWDIIFGVKHGSEFASHRKACRLFMETLHKEFPSVDLYWFSGLAIHVHALQTNPDWHLVTPLKYMSMSRAAKLYHWQMEIMSELTFVKVIHVFEASYLAAEHMPEGDCRHYDEAFHQKIADWYYTPKL